MLDRLVGILVRFVAWVSAFAVAIPGVRLERWNPGQPLKVLLVGYNGARNTGADVRVSALMDQIAGMLPGVKVDMTLMTLDAESTRIYTEGKATQVQFSSIFFWPTLRECSSHHAIVLCEGSMLKSKFANSLTLFMCLAAGIAKRQGKPCIGWGAEVGEMDPFVSRIAAKLCSDVLIMPRTHLSLEALRRLGLRGVLGTDTAWPFESGAFSQQAIDVLKGQGWDGRAPLLGVAVINPFCWPVKPSLARWVKAALTGDKQWHYQKWYFFSWNGQRERAFQTYISNFAQAVNQYCEKAKAFPVLIGMEKLDLGPCRELQKKLRVPSALVPSSEYDGFVIDQVLSKLSLLITSRYHACLLAMKSGVSSVAVSMDERLTGLLSEAGLPDELLLDVADDRLAEHILEGIEVLHEEADAVAAAIDAQRNRSLAMCGTMQTYAWEYLCSYFATAADMH